MTLCSSFSSSEPRRWLCVAYAFPPIARSGTYRTLGFVRHLYEHGWNATVLTTETNGEAVDHALLELVPGQTEILRVPWTDLVAVIRALYSPPTKSGRREVDLAPKNKEKLAETWRMPRTSESRTRSSRKSNGRRSTSFFSEFLSSALKIPDSRLGWLPAAVRAGIKALRNHRHDVIYSTSPYMTAHLIALILHKWTGLPWVADFRDPWTTNPFRSVPFSALAAWDRWLERLVLRCATHVLFNTPAMRDDALARFPVLDKKSSVILNGFDADRITRVRPQRTESPDVFVMTHAGEFYGPRSPGVWFTALQKAAAILNNHDGRTVMMRLIGPEHYGRFPLADLAGEAGVLDSVHIMGRLPHDETLAHLAGSDVLLLAGHTDSRAQLQVPNKLFEYLALRRPIIATFPPRGPVADILREARADAVICDPMDDHAIARALVSYASLNRPIRPDAWQGVPNFARTRSANELLHTFTSLCPSPARRTGPYARISLDQACLATA